MSDKTTTHKLEIGENMGLLLVLVFFWMVTPDCSSGPAGCEASHAERLVEAVIEEAR